ncbi:MAG: prepilin peptidase [Succinivibrionaceae bacterium]|nr:prepilin peptidase [Succinivibrionaceae bacterium]
MFLLGLLVGSFLNVVIYRLPVMMEKEFKKDYLEYFDAESEELAKLNAEPKFNLVVPRSRCPKCGHLISAMENIPVISWLFLRGKCRKCKLPISFRYPSIELLSAVLTLMVAFFFPPSWKLLGAILLTWALISLSFIDFDKMLLPDEITQPFLWLGLVINTVDGFVTVKSAVIGAVLGYLSLWSVYWGFKLITGKEGMGYGDFKLMAVIGAWFGYQMLPLAVLMSALVGAVIGITYKIVVKESASKPIPFGPYIAVTCYVIMLCGVQINDWYLSLMM